MLYILTLNYNGEDKLKKLAPTLLDSLDGINFEWHIKDNASKDKSVDYLKSLDNNKIKILEYKDNSQNFAAGMNYLFNIIKPNDNDFILLLNNDIIFNDTTSIEKMMSIFNKDPDVGVVGAKLLYTDTNLLQHAGVIIDNNYNMPNHFRAKEVDDKNSSKNRLFQIVTGAVLLTKAKYYKHVCTSNKSGINGMDEEYHWAFDDVDLCLSILYCLKKKIVYCGKTNIFHEESASLKKNPVNKMFLKHNIIHLRRKWMNRWAQDHLEYATNPKYRLYE